MKYLVPAIYALVLFIVSELIHAQDFFEPGYIVTLENDTIPGQIKNSSPLNNSVSCVFKQDSDGEVIHYKPGEIKRYQFIDNKCFVSKNLTIDNKDTAFFAEILLDGILDLYYVYYDEFYQYLFENEDGEILLLKKDQRLVGRNEEMMEDMQQEYRNIGSLKYMMNDYPEIHPRIENFSFQQKSMVNLVKDYHNGVCTEYECIDFTKKSKRPLMYVLPSIGIAYNTFYFSGNFDYLTEASGRSESSIEFGFTYGINMPLANKRLWLETRLKHSSYNYSFVYNGGVDVDGDYINPDAEGLASTNLYDFKLTQLDIDVVYVLVDKKIEIKPVFSIGLGFISDENSVLYHTIGYSNLRKLTLYKQFAYLGLGLNIDYEISNGIFFRLSSDAAISVSTMSKIATLGDTYLMLSQSFGVGIKF